MTARELLVSAMAATLVGKGCVRHYGRCVSLAVRLLRHPFGILPRTYHDNVQPHMNHLSIRVHLQTHCYDVLVLYYGGFRDFICLPGCRDHTILQEHSNTVQGRPTRMQ